MRTRTAQLQAKAGIEPAYSLVTPSRRRVDSNHTELPATRLAVGAHDWWVSLPRAVAEDSHLKTHTCLTLRATTASAWGRHPGSTCSAPRKVEESNPWDYAHHAGFQDRSPSARGYLPLWVAGTIRVASPKRCTVQTCRCWPFLLRARCGVRPREVGMPLPEGPQILNQPDGPRRAPLHSTTLGRPRT